jgi:acyl-CoA synthetase (AMP-forming)/AMP-acid ligase II
MSSGHEGSSLAAPGRGAVLDATVPSLGGILQRRALERPDQTLFVSLDQHGQPAATLTAVGLAAAAGALAERLRRVAEPGDRVLLPTMTGLRFHIAFMACLSARLVAVPVPPVQVPSQAGPDGPNRRHLARLTAICGDVRPAAAVVPGSDAADLAAAWAGIQELRDIAMVAAEPAVPEDAAAAPAVLAAEPVAGDELAFIQYTSGSTSVPHGVMITHNALLANQAIIGEHMGVTSRSTMVSWLPPYHDMGLCLGLLVPVYAGVRAVLLAPETFLMHPERWLQAISAAPDAMSAAPDFAYGWCAKRVSPAAKADLDLSGWRVTVNGAEPVNADTLRAFQSAFVSAGLSETTMTPSYGLAESTLFVTGGSGAAAPVMRRYDRQELGAGRATRADPGATQGSMELVGSGWPGPGVTVAIVDPDTRQPLPALAVGEIWVQSPSNGTGYWGRPEKSAETFHARLATDSGTGAAGDSDWLRTGDLGFLDDGELFVTGRRKDMIIIRGANYYPQDFERLALQAHQELGGVAAAFASQNGGRVIVVLETAPDATPAAAAKTAEAAVRAVTAELPVTTDVVVVPRGKVPRTTSGKVRRQECARRLDDGELAVLARWPVRNDRS